jgi:NitT/TauT family transport system substrate-binding protein
MYTNPAAMKHYVEFVKIPENIGKRVRDDFFPREALDPDTIVGLDQILPDAVALKYIAAPLTREQLTELIQIPRK